MTGRFGYAAVTLVASALALVTAAGAQDRAMTGVVIGDGAKSCAAAKTAAFTRGVRVPASVASPGFDATYYHLDLSFPMMNDSLFGSVRVEGTVTGSPMSEMVLDLAQSMRVTSVAQTPGVPLAFTHAGAALRITLPAPVAPGGQVAVTIGYRGVPVSSDFGNLVFGTRSGDRYAWSLSEPYGSREWWPCKDHPSDKADSVRVTVTVPSTYRVGSQGLLVDETINGPTTTYDWRSGYPISTYLVSVAIGDYTRYQGTYERPDSLVARHGPLSLPLDHLVYNDEINTLPTGWANVVDVFPVLEDWFGAYPFPAEKYGHAEFTFGGGMEHQTMSSMGTSAISVVTHELAHQWCGDSISPASWTHLWLNEGFATYSELLYWEARADEYPGTLEAVRDSRYRFAREATGTLVLQDTTSVNEMFDASRVYAKGAMVLDMLRYVAGDTAFKDILRAWAAEPSVDYDVATTAAFQRVAEEVSGLDLDAFFRQWVTRGSGYPSYAVSSAWGAEGAGYRVWVTVTQTQGGAQSNVDAFEMPLEIAVYTRVSVDSLEDPVLVETHREMVRNRDRSQVYEFTVAERPDYVTLDPDRRILRGDDVSSTAPQSLPPYPSISTLGPNPAASSFNLQYLLDHDADVEIDVFDVAGRRVGQQTVPSVQAGLRVENIDISRLPSGVYFLRLSTREGSATRKFVVLR
jgi:aminopeptidase N